MQTLTIDTDQDKKVHLRSGATVFRGYADREEMRKYHGDKYEKIVGHWIERIKSAAKEIGGTYLNALVAWEKYMEKKSYTSIKRKTMRAAFLDLVEKEGPYLLDQEVEAKPIGDS